MRLRARHALIAASAASIGACGLATLGTGASVSDDAGMFTAPDTGLASAEGSVPEDDAAAIADGSEAASDGGDGSAPPTFCSIAAGCNNCDAGPGVFAACEATKTCVADCSSCPNETYSCYSCTGYKGAPAPTTQSCAGVQTYKGQNYLQCYGICNCTTAGDCPGESQVCVSNNFGGNVYTQCETCGQSSFGTSTNGLACKKTGTTCNASTYSCN